MDKAVKEVAVDRMDNSKLNPSQNLPQEQVMEIRNMLKGEAWRICQELWDKHKMLREVAKSGLLRVHKYEEATYAQGFIDGMNEVVKLVTNATTRSKEDEGPIY